MCSSSSLFSLYRHRFWNFHDVNALFERISSDSSSAVSLTGTSAPLFPNFSPRSDHFQRDNETISFETKARDRALVPTLRQFTRNRLWLTSFPCDTAFWLQIFLLLSAIFRGHRDQNARSASKSTATSRIYLKTNIRGKWTTLSFGIRNTAHRNKYSRMSRGVLEKWKWWEWWRCKIACISLWNFVITILLCVI